MNLKAYGHNRLTLVLVQGLQFLHGSRHLVHRDIKPANLLVNLDGEPKITDFGISAGLDNSIAMVRRLHIWIGLIFLCAEAKLKVYWLSLISNTIHHAVCYLCWHSDLYVT